MKAETYRDMHLLNEVTQTPDATQRDFAKRIGVALGLTNLMLRRLATKGYIKIVNVQRSRLRYLITPQGMMEKARLTREYLEYSLFFYRDVRRFLREHLAQMAATGQRRILLWGTGELAEIAFLSIREMGLELVGVVEDPPDHERFLGYPVQSIGDVPPADWGGVLVASLRWHADAAQRLAASGISAGRIIILPQPGEQSVPRAGSATKVQVPQDAVPPDESVPELALKP